MVTVRGESEQHCLGSALSSISTRLRRREHEIMPQVSAAMQHTPNHVCLHALTVAVASRCFALSMPVVGYAAAHKQLFTSPDMVVARLICCSRDGSCSVQVRLEPTRTALLSSQVSMTTDVQAGWHTSCNTPKARVAGLWASLSDLPLISTRSALSNSALAADTCTTGADRELCTPCIAHSIPCGARCETACSTDITSQEYGTDSAAQALVFNVSAESLPFFPTAAVHTPPHLPRPHDQQRDTAKSFQFTTRPSPGSDQADSCTDEQFEGCAVDSDVKNAPITAHPVSLLTRSLQNVVSPPMSSIDGEEGGFSGPLHGATPLGLDSVDGAITDNGNNSEVEAGGMSEVGCVSAPASVTGPLIDASEQHDTPVKDGHEVQFTEQFAQIAAADAVAALADDSICGCYEDTDGIDGASNELEGDITHAAGCVDSVCDVEGVTELPPAVSAWEGINGNGCDCVLSTEMAQNHLESELVDGTAMPLVDPDNMACGDNELEGSMLLPTPPNPEGDVSDTNVLDAPAIHTDHVGVLPSGDLQNSSTFQLGHVGPCTSQPTSNSHTQASSLTLPRVMHTNSATTHGSSSSTSVLDTAASGVHGNPTAHSLRASMSLQRRPVANRRTQQIAAPVLPPKPPLGTSLHAPGNAAQGPMGAKGSGCTLTLSEGVPAVSSVARGAAALVPPHLPPLVPVSSSAQPRSPNTPHLQGVCSILQGSRTALHLPESTNVPSQATIECTSSLEAAPPPRFSPIIRSRSAEDPPDLGIQCSSSTSSLFSQLDQHLLDRIMLHLSSTSSLNPAANVCRRFRNAARRVSRSAALLNGPSSTPPVDPATGALDMRPLQSFPGLRSLRLPKFDRMRTIEVLPVELFRLRMLTQLTYLDIQCAAYVPTFQPLRLLPSLRHLSCAGASLNPPPDLPELPNCEVMLYANRGLSAATRRNVLATLPPLSGLRVPSKAPAALLQQIGSSPSMRTLTYLRLGSCQSPALDPLAPLTGLVRLHLHVVNGHVTPLTTLSMLTYLHLHGHVDDLAFALGSFRKLQKLSLIKCKRLRADEVRAVGTLSGLTSLELPCSKASSPPRDIWPLSRLKNLQHLSLAMPEAGIAPLTRLSALTFLRLKYRAPDDDRPPPTSRIALTASLFSMHLAVSACSPAVRVLSGSAAPDSGNSSTGGGSGPPPCLLSTTMGSVMQSATQAAIGTAVTLAGAAAFPLAVYATRRAWTAVSHTLFPPALDAGRLTDLCHMTQLEWLEVKSSTMPTPEEWSAALRPLTRLRRLDVRNTSFRDPHALQDMPFLRVVLISGCTGLPRSNQALQEAASLREDAEIRR